MGPQFLQAGMFLIHSIFGLATLVFALRFLLRIIGANFYNPICQFIVKVSDPFVLPLQKIIPVINRIDLSCLVLLVSTNLLKYTLILLLIPLSLEPIYIAVHAIADSIEQFVDIFFWAVMLNVLMSWISPYQTNPLTHIIEKLSTPLLSRARTFMPSLGGFDLSPIPVLMGLQVIKILIPG